MKKLIALTLIFVLSASFSSFAYVFTHLGGVSDWAKPEIEKAEIADLYYCGWVQDFQKELTRREYCGIAVSLYEGINKIKPIWMGYSDDVKTHPFTDTNDSYVGKAYSLGLVKGVSETEFAPNEILTREQMAVMLARITEKFSYKAEMGDLTQFEDFGDVSDWAIDGLSKMNGMGIIKGKTEKILAPQEKITFEEAVVMMWRVYNAVTGKDFLSYEDTTIDIFSETGIITEEELKTDEYISTRRFFEILSDVTGYKAESYDLSRWYLYDNLAPLDDVLSDEDKLLLIGHVYSGKNPLLTVEEIPSISLDAQVTEFDAVKYITRLVGETFGCTDPTMELIITDKAEFYEIAAAKGIIESENTDNADKPLLSSEVYEMLHKALFVVFNVGGYTTSTNRYIDGLLNRKNAVPKEEKPEPTVTATEIPSVKFEYHDDLSVSWELPEEYKKKFDSTWTVRLYVLMEDGSEKFTYYSGYGGETGYAGSTVIKHITQRNNPENAVGLKYTIFKTDNEKNEQTVYFFNMPFNSFEIVLAEKAPTPGKYVTEKDKWPMQEITLGDGETFDPESYYLLIGREKRYRSDRFNTVDYFYIKPEIKSDKYVPTGTGSNGVGNIDDIRIRKITVEGNAKTGVKLVVSPESDTTFERVEK